MTYSKKPRNSRKIENLESLRLFIVSKEQHNKEAKKDTSSKAVVHKHIKHEPLIQHSHMTTPVNSMLCHHGISTLTEEGIKHHNEEYQEYIELVEDLALLYTEEYTYEEDICETNDSNLA